MNYSVNNTLTHSSFLNSENVNYKKDSKNESDLFSIDNCNKDSLSDNCDKVKSKYGFSQNHDAPINNDQIRTGINPDIKFDLSRITEKDKKDQLILGIKQKFILYGNSLSLKGVINESSCNTSMELKNPGNVTVVGCQSKLKINKDKCNLV